MSSNYFCVNANILNSVRALTGDNTRKDIKERIAEEPLTEKSTDEPLRVQRKNELRQAYMLTRYNRFVNTMNVHGLSQAINEVNLTETKATKKFINKKFREEFHLYVDLF